MRNTTKAILHNDTRRAPPQSGAPRPALEFKPVALPAVAAAVHALRSGPRREPAHREMPAILRQLGFVD